MGRKKEIHNVCTFLENPKNQAGLSFNISVQEQSGKYLLLSVQRTWGLESHVTIGPQLLKESQKE